MPAIGPGTRETRAANRRRATRLGFFAGLAATCATAACSPTASDCFGIQPGNRVAITVNDLAPNASSGACGFGFDMTQGLRLVATDLDNPDTSGLAGSTCNSARVSIDPFATWTWTATATAAGTDPTVLVGFFSATNGTCTGDTSMTVLAPSGQPFAVADAGQGSNVVMNRSFNGHGDGGAGCPSICVDSFFVTLEQL
jgi:hypothetical protein